MTKQPHCSAIAILLFFTLIQGPFTARAQNAAEKGLPFITNYSIKDYQAHPQNWSIIEDNRGIMYFGNSICLLEYDGVRWRKLRFGDNNTQVRSLAKDKSGRIYFGAYSNLGYLTPDSLGQMKLCSLIKMIPEAYRTFTDIFSIDITPAGIYFQSRERIFRLSPKPGEPAKWDVKVWESPTKFMYAFYRDGIYYVHQQGVGFLRMINDQLVKIPGSDFLGNERIQVMLPYPAGNDGGKRYLMGLFYSGLYVFDGKTFTPFITEADAIFKSATLYKGDVLADGSYALSTTGKGLVIMSAAGKIIQLLNKDVGLQDESVYTVFTDRKGTLWLGLDNGISRVATSSPFTQFTVQSGISNAVLCLKRFEGTVYAGTANGLIRFNRQTAKFEPVSSLGTNQIFNVVQDSDRLLVAADGLYAIKNNKSSIIKSSVGGDFQINSLFRSKQNPGILVAGVIGGAGIFYKQKTGKKEAANSSNGWLFAGRISGIDADIWTMADGQNKTLLLGSNVGIFRVSNFTDSNGIPVLARAKVEKFGSAQGLSTGTIAVFSAGDKEFFVSNNAVYNDDKKINAFVPDTTLGKIGFGNDPNEYNMVEDQQNRLWVNFGRETVLETPAKDGKYTSENTQFLPFTDRAIFRIFPEADGITWFASNEGLIKYDEKKEENYDQSYKTLIRSVTAGQMLLNGGAGVNGSNTTPIPYQNNAIRYEYAAPFFDKENKTQYQTWLESFEPGWSEWGSNFYKEYTNLSEGKYTFHVRAKNIYRKISDEATYTFTIQPPWWRTWWAYLLYISIGLAALWFFIRWRLRLLKKEKLLLEEKVKTRTQELEQEKEKVEITLTELTSTQAQLIQSEKMASLGELTAGIAHEIQNPLNFVNNFSEVSNELITEMNDELDKGAIGEAKAIALDIQQNLEKINQHGKRADAIVKGMLQHSRSSSAVREPTDINRLADEYLLLAYHGWRAKDTSFHATLKKNYDQTIGLVNIIPQDIARVILNLVTNAFYAVAEKKKVTPDGYLPEVSIITRKTGNLIDIQVKDNGSGIPEKLADKVFQPFFTTKPTGLGTGLGLSMAYDIIKAHGGELKVKSTDGEGSIFIIQIPA